MGANSRLGAYLNKYGKTSYNVLSHSHWRLGQFFSPLKYGLGGLVKKRESPNFVSPEVSISVYESFLLEYTVKG